jgi:hypothetical protein
MRLVEIFLPLNDNDSGARPLVKAGGRQRRAGGF